MTTFKSFGSLYKSIEHYYTQQGTFHVVSVTSYQDSM